MLPGAAFAAASAIRFGGMANLTTAYSIALHGANSYMNIGQGGDLNIAPDVGTYSGAIWFYTTSLASEEAIGAKAYSNSTHIDFKLGITSAGALYLYCGDVSTASSNGAVVVNTWYLAGWSVTGGVGKLYLNGTQVGSNISCGSETSSADWLWGASRYNDGDNAGDSYPFQGLLNNLMMYQAYALSGAQHAQLYNSGVPKNPTTGAFAANLTHWYRMGDDATHDLNDAVTTAYHIHDQVGTKHGLLTNIFQGAMWQKSPTGAASSTYAYLAEDAGVDMHFRATDLASGTSDWTAAFGSWTGIWTNGGGTSVKQTSGFAGVSEVTQGDWWRMAPDASFHLLDTTTWTLAFRYYTGALDVSGGFFFGNDASTGGSGNADYQGFNKNYNIDVGFRAHDSTATEFEASAANLQNANKYVSMHVSVDIAAGRLAIFENGSLQSQYVDTHGTWTSRSQSESNDWKWVCWSPDLAIFCAVADSGTHRVMTSSDGITWANHSAAAANAWESVCWSPALMLFVAVSSTGTNRVMTSPDGSTWTAHATGGVSAHPWTAVCWSPDLAIFCAVPSEGGGGLSSATMTSSNGTSWTVTETTPPKDQWECVIWVPELALFVAVANSESGVNVVMTSANGSSWTLQTAASSNWWSSVCWSPELSLLVAVSQDGYVQTSPDAINWTLGTSTVLNRWESVCWSPQRHLFVAISANAGLDDSQQIMVSRDGYTWLPQTPSENNYYASVCWSPGLKLFAAVAGDGTHEVITNPGTDFVNFGANTTTPPLGLMGVAYFSTGGYESTANGQRMIEMARYQGAMSSRTIAEREAQWNVAKGWI